MLSRTYLATIAGGIVSNLTDAGFDVRTSDAEIHFAARAAAQRFIAINPTMRDDRDDIETAIVSVLFDWRDEHAALDAEVAETVAEMRAADGPF